MNVERAHYIGVMQRRTLDDRTRQQHRFEIGDRRNDSHSSDIERHKTQTCQSSFGPELVGHSPTWRLCRKTEIKLFLKDIYFKNKTVGRYRQLFPGRVPIFYESVDIRY